jgi:hypothetical protein
LWRKNGRNPDQVLGSDSGIAQRQLERRQTLFVLAVPLGEENALGDHVFGQFRNPPDFSVRESSNLTYPRAMQDKKCDKK